MEFYWVLIIIIASSMVSLMISAQYAVALKHQFDENYKPKFEVNEAEVYVVGSLGGSLGLLIAYIAYGEIRKNDSFNSRRFLWITLAILAVHVTIVTVLSVLGYITY